MDHHPPIHQPSSPLILQSTARLGLFFIFLYLLDVHFASWYINLTHPRGQSISLSKTGGGRGETASIPFDDVTVEQEGTGLSTAIREEDLHWTLLDLLGGGVSKLCRTHLYRGRGLKENEGVRDHFKKWDFGAQFCTWVAVIYSSLQTHVSVICLPCL